MTPSQQFMALPQAPGRLARRDSLWRDSLYVLLMVVAPVTLIAPIFFIAIGITVRWQRMHGQPVSLPSYNTLGDIALLLYTALTILDLLIVWRWSSRRGFARDVFQFRRLSMWDAVIAVAGFVIAMYGAPVVNAFLSQTTHVRSIGYGSNLHHLLPLAAYVLGTVVVPPIGEEILYRGLLVAWFRRLGWPVPVIWLAGSLLFGASHWMRYGLAWSLTMVCFGALLYGIRFWRGSLTPAWLMHTLFNLRGTVIIPLIARMVPALVP
jgi:membrane protease YdiL (CAAX protease family)